MARAARGAALAILFASLVQSCFLFRREQSRATNGFAVVRVENGDQHDISVFFIQLGQRFRLGTVTALSATSFEVPERLIREANQAQLVADPVGARTRVTSEPFVLRPGQRMVWTVEAGLRRSSLAIF